MKNEKKIANEYNLKLHIQNIHELWKFENLKVYKQNFHEIEKISTKPHVYEPINEIISTLKICKIKFVKKKLLERKILKCIWKMSMKDLKKKCEECGKNFTHNIGLKGHITAVHEKRFNCDQCGKNLATRCNSLQKNSTNHIYRLELVSHIRVSIDHDTSWHVIKKIPATPNKQMCKQLAFTQ